MKTRGARLAAQRVVRPVFDQKLAEGAEIIWSFELSVPKGNMHPGPSIYR